MEGFVNETQAKEDVITTFITVSLVFFGMVVAFLLIWAYNKSDIMFVIAFAGMVSLYALITVIFVAIIRSKITSAQFKLFMISSVFTALLSAVVLILFVVKAMSLFKNVNSSQRIEQSSSMMTPMPNLRSTPEMQMSSNDQVDDIFQREP
jgi:hypothetical protein